MIKPKYLINLMADNIVKTKSPVGIHDSSINTWWQGVTKDRGEWLMFTGLLYQLTPYINMTARLLERLENSRFQNVLPLLNRLPKYFFNLLKLMIPSREIEDNNRTLQSIYRLLTRCADVYYRADVDVYSGIMLYDLGSYEEFEDHVKYVVEKLREKGIQKIVTVDPHTTYALSVLYPEYSDFDFEVRNYLELISDAESLSQLSADGNGRIFSIHDPCYYGRHLDLSGCPRNILESMGIEYQEVRNSGKHTFCCGGPLETLFPKISNEIARKRVKEFGDREIITLCPICAATLRRAGGQVRDFASIFNDHC